MNTLEQIRAALANAPADERIDTREAARLLKVSTGYLRTLHCQGKGPPAEVVHMTGCRRRVWYKRSQVIEFAANVVKVKPGRPKAQPRTTTARLRHALKLRLALAVLEDWERDERPPQPRQRVAGVIKDRLYKLFRDLPIPDTGAEDIVQAILDAVPELKSDPAR